MDKSIFPIVLYGTLELDVCFQERGMDIGNSQQLTLIPNPTVIFNTLGLRSHVCSMVADVIWKSD